MKKLAGDLVCQEEKYPCESPHEHLDDPCSATRGLFHVLQLISNIINFKEASLTDLQSDSGVL